VNFVPPWAENLVNPILARLDAMDARLNEIDAHLDRIDARLGEIDDHLDAVDERTTRLEIIAIQVCSVQIRLLILNILIISSFRAITRQPVMGI